MSTQQRLYKMLSLISLFMVITSLCSMELAAADFVLIGTDPNDMPSVPNINQVFVKSESNKLYFKATSYKNWANDVIFAVFVDSDLSPNTGLFDAGIGADYQLLIYLENGDLYGGVLAHNDAKDEFEVTDSELGDAILSPNSNVIQFSINVNDIGSPKTINFVAVMGVDFESDGDLAPDTGYYPYNLDGSTNGGGTPSTGDLIFSDDFNDCNMDGWTKGGLTGDWRTLKVSDTNCVLKQYSNAYDGTEGRDGTYISTYVYAGNESWTDYDFQVRLNPVDDDGIGVIFRYINSNNYYRLLWLRSSGGPFLRLDKIINGTQKVLIYDNSAGTGYDPSKWYTIKVSAFGSRIGIYIDDKLWKEAIDADIPKGMIGLLCYAEGGAQFDDVKVYALNGGTNGGGTQPTGCDAPVSTKGPSKDFVLMGTDPDDAQEVNINQVSIKSDASKIYFTVTTHKTALDNFIIYVDMDTDQNKKTGHCDICGADYTVEFGVEDGKTLNDLWVWDKNQGDWAETNADVSYVTPILPGNVFFFTLNLKDINNPKAIDFSTGMLTKKSGEWVTVDNSPDRCYYRYIIDETSGTQGDSCPGSPGHSYLVVTQAMTWKDANAHAVSLGGHLVTINSETENKCVTDIARAKNANNFWIGLTDEVKEGTFVWITGEPVTYTNWYPGEPNNKYGENYTSIGYVANSYYTWTDLSGNQALPFVVEFDNLAPPAGGGRTLIIPEVTGSPGKSVTVPINISDASGVAGADINVLYDPKILKITDANVKTTTLSSGMSLVANTNTSGKVIIRLAGTNAIASGSGSLVDMIFTIDASAVVGTETPVTFESAEVFDANGLNITIGTQNGKVKIVSDCVKGDVNGDGGIKSNDAILTLRISAGLLVPTEQQFCAADYNNDKQVKSNDAILILRKSAGLIAPDKNYIASGSRDISISFAEARLIQGERVMASLMVNNPDILAGGDMCIAYDSSILKAVNVSFEDGILQEANLAEPGIVRIAFATNDRLKNKNMAKVEFEVLTYDVFNLSFHDIQLYGPDALPLNLSDINKISTFHILRPEHNALLQNFPNPFNPETWIPYQLKEDCDVTIMIYSSTGGLVRTLTLGHKPIGFYTGKGDAAYWDGKNEYGEFIASGVYFYTIRAGNFTAMRKMVITR